MKRLLLILYALISSIAVCMSQQYEVDCLRGDSTEVFNVKSERLSGQKDLYYSTTSPAGFSLYNGETVEGIGKVHGKNSATNGFSLDYLVFKRDGKLYAVVAENMLFSERNPDGTKDILGKKVRMMHSAQGRFFMSYTPYIIIAVLFLGIMLLNGLAIKRRVMKRVAVVAVPLCILVGSLLEVWAYRVLGTDCFWWCDKNHYGFFGSLLRIIPFALIVFYQLMSIRFYEPLLFGDDFDPDIHDGVSIKPALLGILLVVPVTIAAAIIADKTALKHSGWEDFFILACFCLSLFGGIVVSAKRNIERLHSVKTGLLLTLFSLVYIVGCIVAVWGLVVVLFKLIIQVVLFIVGALFLFKFLPADAFSSSSSGSPRVYYDKHGFSHTSAFDRDQANRRIDQQNS